MSRRTTDAAIAEVKRLWVSGQWTCRQIAHKTGVGRTTVSHILAGTYPRPKPVVEPDPPPTPAAVIAAARAALAKRGRYCVTDEPVDLSIDLSGPGLLPGCETRFRRLRESQIAEGRRKVLNILEDEVEE